MPRLGNRNETVLSRRGKKKTGADGLLQAERRFERIIKNAIHRILLRSLRRATTHTPISLVAAIHRPRLVRRLHARPG
jgi:hypothetical protein